MNAHLYSAASGLALEQRRVETIANNLANLSTTGFRTRRLYATVHGAAQLAAAPPEIAAASSRPVALSGSYEVPGQGVRRPTGRALDVAPGDNALLVVDTPAGRRYTRDGSLAVSLDGRLTTGGHPVLGQDGKPIRGLAGAATVQPDGRVVDRGAESGRLLVVRDVHGVLQPAGDNLLTAAGQDAALETVKEPELNPGTLDVPGGDALGELVRLIDAQRAFESYQRIVDLTMNDVNRKTVNEIST
jgi:flagellar basal body rod protein FlgG